MSIPISSYQSQIIHEIENMPIEYLPNLLKIIQLFKESVTLKLAEESFKNGWQEAIEGDTHPISELWEDIDAE